MRSFLKKITPAFLVALYKNLKKKKRAKQLADLQEKGQTLTAEKIVADLRSLGITTGNTVMLHSSLSKLGYVEGGAQTVINSFLSVIGQSGTLAMPSFPAVGFNFDYLKKDPLFDLVQTPSRMGQITEVFRKMPGVERSFHPTEPVCALGPKAIELTGSHYDQLTPYNSNSPFYKLCESRAKIVLLGVDFNSLTNLHTVEDAVENFKFPVYHKHIFECRMRDRNGNNSVVRTKCHDPAWSKRRQCNGLIEPFRKAGFLKEGKIGYATVYVIDAAPMHDWMVKNYHENGVTMYTPQGEK